MERIATYTNQRKYSSKSVRFYRLSTSVLWGLMMTLLTSCTGQLLDSFRYKNSQEAFSSQIEINTKVDLLWVVDNSSSMDIAQKNFREKVAGFSDRYLSPHWDIQIGVITTDAYLANPVFADYLNSQVAGSVGFRSVHLNRLVTDKIAQNLNETNDEKMSKLHALGVSFNPLTRGTFVSGYKFKDLVPAWARGLDYARLVTGVRDGPISGLCIERQTYFFAPNADLNSDIIGPDCSLRDVSNDAGVEKCLNPSSGESSVSECVNTALNDTVRTGKPILNTALPENYSGNESDWKQQLASDFMVNISVGSVGGGSERGLSSIEEFINLNETSPSKFFRKGSLRAIVVISDEDDQSVVLPEQGNVPAGYEPFSGYRCDLNALVDANTGKFDNPETFITTTYGYCCAGNSCRFENLGCPSKIVDGEEVKVGVCPNPSDLIPVNHFKNKLDQYFSSLDAEEDESDESSESANSNYFVVSIVPTSKDVLNELRSERYLSDDRLDEIELFNGAGAIVTNERMRIPAVDYGERYVQFANAVGNGSLVMDIGAEDYGAVLDHIGKTLIEKKSTFSLRFEPTQKSDILIKVVRPGGDEQVLLHEQYEFEGKTLRVVDEALILNLKAEDQIYIDYQPSSLNE